MLDVVYNHFGPDGNCLRAFTPRYFSGAGTDWGEAIDFDGDGSAPVREFFVENAAYWIREFHLDGLRFDAAHAIRDRSGEHVIAAAARAARAAAERRRLLLVAECETQEARLARPAAAGGCGLDGVWNDDFHHAARVALTGRREGYYGAYRGTARELLACLLGGYLYQGQVNAVQGKPWGSEAGDLPPAAFVHYLENHDQVGHSLDGRRLSDLADPARLRALTALLLLGPQTPLLFQGQESGDRAPFPYFADHAGELGLAVRDGRRRFLSQFPSLAAPEGAGYIPDPGDPAVFARAKLDRGARDGRWLALHKDLLALRRAERRLRTGAARGATLSESALVLRWPDRLLAVNLGADLPFSPAPEPLLAPPAGGAWILLWSSERVEYGGGGSLSPVDDAGRRQCPASWGFPKGPRGCPGAGGVC
jgi:maltooligosyltrehalose trehalohydrolase